MRQSACRPLPASLVAAAALVTLACGGGTEVAPATPVSAGAGSAAGSLATADLGGTQQVSGGIAREVAAEATVTGETVTFGAADDLARLAHGNVIPTRPISMTDGGALVYRRGATAACVSDPTPCDYWFEDFVGGVLRRNPAGAVPVAPGVAVINYSYNQRLLALNIGIVFTSGTNISLTVHNVESTLGPTLTTTEVSSSAPTMPPDVAFWVVATSGSTTATPIVRVSVQDPGNPADPAQLVLDQLDLSDEVRPCIGGHLTVNVQSPTDSAPLLLDLDFATPAC